MTYDIPSLTLPEPSPLRLRDLTWLAWGGRSRKLIVSPSSAYHFYVDDSHFSRLWRVPDQLLKTCVKVAVEVNYSIWDDTPFYEAVLAVGRKRWLSRYWQSKGVVPVVDMNVSERYRELNLEGVPDGWRLYGTRGYRGKHRQLYDEYVAALARAGVEIEFLVYGGGRAVEEFCGTLPGAFYVADHMTQVGRDRKAGVRWPRVLA